MKIKLPKDISPQVLEVMRSSLKALSPQHRPVKKGNGQAPSISPQVLELKKRTLKFLAPPPRPVKKGNGQRRAVQQRGD